jgi:hypothetical protein
MPEAADYIAGPPKSRSSARERCSRFAASSPAHASSPRENDRAVRQRAGISYGELPRGSRRRTVPNSAKPQPRLLGTRGSDPAYFFCEKSPAFEAPAADSLRRTAVARHGAGVLNDAPCTKHEWQRPRTREH